jgi:hypothetical protein
MPYLYIQMLLILCSKRRHLTNGLKQSYLSITSHTTVKHLRNMYTRSILEKRNQKEIKDFLQ